MFRDGQGGRLKPGAWGPQACPSHGVIPVRGLFADCGFSFCPRKARAKLGVQGSLCEPHPHQRPSMRHATPGSRAGNVPETRPVFS